MEQTRSNHLGIQLASEPIGCGNPRCHVCATGWHYRPCQKNVISLLEAQADLLPLRNGSFGHRPRNNGQRNRSPSTIPEKTRNPVHFNKIDFTYAQRKESTRNNEPDSRWRESRNFRRRSCTWYVGENGSGKSTLVNLLPRFYDPDRGNVFINEIDIRDIRLKELRKSYRRCLTGNDVICMTQF